MPPQPAKQSIAVGVFGLTCRALIAMMRNSTDPESRLPTETSGNPATFTERPKSHAATVAVVIFGHGLFFSCLSRVDRVADLPWRPSREDGARYLSFVPQSPSLKLARKVGLVVTVSKNSAARFVGAGMGYFS